MTQRELGLSLQASAQVLDGQQEAHEQGDQWLSRAASTLRRPGTAVTMA